ncbi:uncharacterized protein [Henckelia pumila]|uniref:uncharacterized protein n=1 Tax=Henckelia pumila TaxID=405737 RepID=UPI003C6E54EF
MANLTLYQLTQLITRTVEEALNWNQPPPPPPPPGGGQPNQMDSLWEELWRLVRQLGGRPGPIHKKSPFSLAISNEELRVFLTTLVNSVQQWFNLLQPGSIHRFNDFNTAFVHQFASSKKFLKTSLSLFTLKQFKVEPLREYIQRFNTAALEVPDATVDMLVNSFTQGLKGGEFFKSLVKKPSVTFDELLDRAKKYAKLENSHMQRRLEGSSESKSGAKAEEKVEVWKKRAMEEQGRAKGSYPYVPLTLSLEKAMQILGDEVQRIIHEDPRMRVELDHLVMAKLPNGETKGMRVEETYPTSKEELPKMINGDTWKARKAYRHRLKNFEVNSQSNYPTNPDISFGRDDLKDVVVPHNDPLLVSLTIANYDVAGIFVGTRSSINIIFKETLDQMKLYGFELEPITTVLYGFTVHALQHLSQIMLALSLGSREHHVTKMACFTVVDAPSSFNRILGRHNLSDIRVVDSTYHQNFKFSVGREVGVVRGGQKLSRLCYVNEVKIDAKRAQNELKLEPRELQGSLNSLLRRWLRRPGNWPKVLEADGDGWGRWKEGVDVDIEKRGGKS